MLNSLKRFAGASAAALALILAPVAANAAIINYGDSPVLTSGVQFHQVTESSGTDAVPLFGPPSYVDGSTDVMHFVPKAFVASSTGGTTDITDGQLNYDVTGGAQVGINSLSVNEGGDYTLAGSGTTITQLLAGVIFNIRVTEIDGVAITPISFSQNVSFGVNLLANPGVVAPWSMSATVPIAAELTALNIPYSVGATHVEVSMDNQLVAFSEFQSASFISKKAFDVSVIYDQHGGGAPEPEPSLLAFFSLAPLILRRKRSDA